MLRNLTIQNYALISKLEVDFSGGLTVITGETGAGKSILMGAVSLLLGKRADTGVLKDGSRKCVVEGTFIIKDRTIEDLFKEHEIDFYDETIIRREISPQGKSRAMINDSLVNLTVMRDISGRLLDIHSQNENQVLKDPEFPLDVVDSFLKDPGIAAEYSSIHTAYNYNLKELNKARNELHQLIKDRDYLQFQWNELDKAGLVTGEMEKLEEENEMLEHAVDIHSRLVSATQILSDDDSAVVPRLKQVIQELNQITAFYKPVSEYLERLESAYLDIKDLSGEIEQKLSDVEFDPARFKEVQDRLDVINNLLQKHQVKSEEELIQLRDEYDSRLQSITTNEEEVTQLEQRHDEIKGQLKGLAEKLSGSRREVISGIESKTMNILRQLGIPNARFEIRLVKMTDFGSRGIDQVRLFFAANKNQHPEEVQKVASGGETSRMMLAIKSLISDRLSVPTIIFDEIDSGVSGEIADKMGQVISKISEDKQVLNITHLPQVARHGTYHFKVFKYDDDHTTHTSIKKLSGDERVVELAHLLSGENLTEEALSNAKALLD